MRVAAALLIGALTMGAHAQMEGMKMPQSPTGSQVAPSAAVDSVLSAFEKEFMAAANAMPADKYTFSPAALAIPGAKYDGVKTFGQEITHVAQANYSIYAAASGLKPDLDVKSLGALTKKDEIVAAAAASFAFAHKAIATLTLANANESVKGGGTQTKETLAEYGAVHGFDHYGQMVEYLRMNGIVPAGSK